MAQPRAPLHSLEPGTIALGLAIAEPGAIARAPASPAAIAPAAARSPGRLRPPTRARAKSYAMLLRAWLAIAPAPACEPMAACLGAGALACQPGSLRPIWGTAIAQPGAPLRRLPAIARHCHCGSTAIARARACRCQLMAARLKGMQRHLPQDFFACCNGEPRSVH